LIKYEFKKAVKANYVSASLVVMLLMPLFSLLLMTLDSRGFQQGDFNQINLILLGLVGSKTIFPLVGMFLIKTELEQDGLIGIFVTPINRLKLLVSKIFAAIIWSVCLIVFSAIVVIIVELILFKDLNIFYLVKNQMLNYIVLIFYVIPYIIIGMMFSFVMNHVIMPMIIFIIIIVTGYLMQLFNPIYYLPSAIPEYISDLPKESGSMTIAFILLYGLGVLSFLILQYIFKNKDY